jgi:hypothetical protein
MASGVESDWVVDVATGRIVHGHLLAQPTVLDGSATLKRHSEHGGPVTDDKEREEALKDLSPIEDIKGAIRYIKDLDPIEDVKEFMETAVKVLEPSESDLRVVEPEEDSASEQEERRASEHVNRPAEADPEPDAKALNKEHRGY